MTRTPPASTRQLYCRVETPKGTPITDRPAVQRTPVCPVDCGYFPDTLISANRPLEAIVCVSHPSSAGRRLAVKPLALLRVRERLNDQEFVLCVALDDPQWRSVDRVQDLPAEMRADIERFIAMRQPHEGQPPLIVWCSRDDALIAIDDAAARWAATVNGHG